MTTSYFDLTPDQRINAKANALVFYSFQREGKGLFARVSNRNPGLFSPGFPFYAIQYKTNDRDYESVPSDWWSGGVAENH